MRAAPDRATTVGPLFVAINRAGIPHELIESELLGYKDGAFAGAGRGGQVGKVELAGRGTPCLDEIRQMPLGMQTELWRVLQDGDASGDTKPNTRDRPQPPGAAELTAGWSGPIRSGSPDRQQSGLAGTEGTARLLSPYG